MTKWADYCIFAVRVNTHRTHIDRVQAFPDKSDSFGTAVEFSRLDVVAAIKRGTTFVTVFKGADGNYKLGNAVFIVLINGSEYIKTVTDNTPVDNLDNLPEF